MKRKWYQLSLFTPVAPAYFFSQPLQSLKSFFTFVVFLFYGTSMAMAEDFTVGNFKYTVLSTSQKTVSVAQADNASISGELTIPEAISYGGNEYTVTEIAWNGFAECDATSVFVPSSIIKISALAFSGCMKLASISLPTYLQSIGKNVFYDCYKLKEIECKAFFPPTITANTFDEDIRSQATLYTNRCFDILQGG